MKKQVIALDIDGVLADWVSFGLPRLNELLKKNVKIEDHTFFDLHTTFGVSKQEIEAAYLHLYDNFSIFDLAPVKGAQEAVELLHENYDLVAVTARPSIYLKETKLWLKKYFKKDISLHFGAGAGKPVGGGNHQNDKMAICKKLNAIYLIEDNPSEISSFLKSKTRPLCHAWPWNSSITNYPQVPRGDWAYLIKYITKQGHNNCSN